MAVPVIAAAEGRRQDRLRETGRVGPAKEMFARAQWFIE
jgi:hypothetical protein